MESFGKKSLDKQVAENEQEMFDISHARFEQERDTFEALSEEEKVLLNKYTKVTQGIETIENDIERTVEKKSREGQLKIQTNQREYLLEVKKELEEELKMFPHLVSFLRKHAEQEQLKNPDNPILN